MKTVSFTTAALLAVGTAGAASAQDTANGTASVEVVYQAGITATDPNLEFGQMTPNGSSVFRNVSPSNANAAAFSITGEPGTTYSVAVQETSVDLDETDSTEYSIVVANFQVENQNGSGSSVTLDSSGSGGVNVGGELTIDGRPPSGNYSGQFTVTLNQQ